MWERWLSAPPGICRFAVRDPDRAAVTEVPLALPVLPVDAYVRYAAALGVGPETEEKKEVGRLSQFFADRQGWDQFVDQVAQAWIGSRRRNAHPPPCSSGTTARPAPSSTWAAPVGCAPSAGTTITGLGARKARPAEVMIVLSREPDRLRQRFASVERVGETECGDCMPYENHIPIFLCRGLRSSLAEAWPALKHYE